MAEFIYLGFDRAGIEEALADRDRFAARVADRLSKTAGDKVAIAAKAVIEARPSGELPSEGVIEFAPPSFPRIELCSAVSEELLARLAEYPDDRFRLNPRLFEETVAELLDRMGWLVKLTPYSGDHGRDIIAKSESEPVPLLMLVECKRYARKRPVGPEPVTRLWYRLNVEKANVAMVVTTSNFQPVAKQIARERDYQVSLKEGTDFIDWIRKLRRP